MAFIPAPMIGIGMGVGVAGTGGGGGGSDPGPFSANAVNFDGTNDRLDRGGAFTGVANTNLGLVSLWFNMGGGDGNNHSMIEGSSGRVQIARVTTNKFKFEVSNVAGGFVYSITTTATFLAAGGWNHILVSMDVGGPARRQVYINDVVPALDVDNSGAGPIGWAVGTETSVGSNAGVAVSLLNGDLAEVYFNTTESLDLSVESNRRKFIDAAGKPVDLGADGSTPTGTAPLMFLSGPTVDWHTNKGSGGGMTEVGALTDAATSPSD